MSAPLVKPEFGPTLPQLLAPRLARLPRPARLALGVVGAAVVALGVWLAVRPDPHIRHAVIRGSVAFNLRYPDSLQRVPGAGDLLALRTASGARFPASFMVRPLRLAAYRGDPSAQLALQGTFLSDRLLEREPGLILRDEGRTNINQIPGYQVTWQTKRGGKTTYGRDVMLLPAEPGVREGVVIELVAARSPQTPKADAIGSNGALKIPLRSFRFGTERP